MDIVTVSVSAEEFDKLTISDLLRLMVETKQVDSMSEAKRLLKQGGIDINGIKVIWEDKKNV